MLSNKELQTLRSIRNTIPLNKLSLELTIIIEKYERVAEKLKAKMSISSQELQDKRKEGLSISQCAKHFGCSPSMIDKLIKLYKLTGIGGNQQYNYERRESK